MPGNVGSEFSAHPEIFKRLLRVAVVDVLLACHGAQRVVHSAVDAVVPDLVARSQVVPVVGEWAVDDAALLTHSVAAEAGDGVQNLRLDEVSCVTRFVPVSAVSR